MNGFPSTTCLLLTLVSIQLFGNLSATAQVRTKRPDRGVYDPTAGVGGSSRSSQSAARRGSEAQRSEKSLASVEPVRIDPLIDPAVRTANRDGEEEHQHGLHVLEDTREVPSRGILEFRPLSDLSENRDSSPARAPYRSPQLVRPASAISVSQEPQFAQPTQVFRNAPAIRTHRGQVVHSQQSRLSQPSRSNRRIRRVNSDLPIMGSSLMHGDVVEYGGVMGTDGGYYGEPVCGTEFMYDDGYGGCDGCGYGGCDGCAPCGRMSNACLYGDPCQWWGSLELLLMFRKGDFIRPLITTDPATELGDAGQLPNATILAGDQNILDEMTAGGRLTLGTWIDNCQNRSLVFRLWTATEEEYGFSGDQNTHDVLGIPFFNVDNGEQDVNLLVFPDGIDDPDNPGESIGLGRFGSASVSATSNVYGADVSVRQFWRGGLGTAYDVLYGYQYMRLDEDLLISTRSTQTEGNVGNSIAITDSFDNSSEFHGGQFGFAGRYREGCWSFDWLAKTGFGQVRRSSDRRGTTVASNGAPPATTTNEGFLVRNSNAGTFENDTFGWVPEFDVSLGWHRYPRFDVTFGYQIIAMTDALQISGSMDPDGATNDSNGLLPSPALRYDTFYVHGLHFGIRHVY